MSTFSVSSSARRVLFFCLVFELSFPSLCQNPTIVSAVQKRPTTPPRLNSFIPNLIVPVTPIWFALNPQRAPGFFPDPPTQTLRPPTTTTTKPPTTITLTSPTERTFRTQAFIPNLFAAPFVPNVKGSTTTTVPTTVTLPSPPTTTTKPPVPISLARPTEKTSQPQPFIPNIFAPQATTTTTKAPTTSTQAPKRTLQSLPFVPEVFSPSRIPQTVDNSQTNATTSPPDNFTPLFVQFIFNFVQPTEATPNETRSGNRSFQNNSFLYRPSPVLFGFPAFCDYSVVRECSNTTVNQCDKCSMVGAGFFAFFVVLLGLSVIVANSIVIWLFLKGKSIFTGTYGKIKVSLAFADLLVGFLLFFVVLPNFARTVTSTPNQILNYTIQNQGSPGASVGGIFFILIIASSLYHLVLLAHQRLYAIKWPIRYKQQTTQTVYIEIAVVWLLALLCAVCPLWFPNIFTFGYQQIAFLFTLTVKNVSSGDASPLIVMSAIVYVLPFIFMTLLTILTGIYLRKYIIKSSNITAKKQNKRELMVFKTMAMMQLAFTLTMIPLVVIISMTYSGVLNQNNISSPYVICFYMSMSNSLANVLVYSVADATFRNAVKNLVLGCLGIKTTKAGDTTQSNKPSRTSKSALTSHKDSGTHSSHQVDSV